MVVDQRSLLLSSSVLFIHLFHCYHTQCLLKERSVPVLNWRTSTIADKGRLSPVKPLSLGKLVRAVSSFRGYFGAECRARLTIS
jgi:hypothetical protein